VASERAQRTAVGGSATHRLYSKEWRRQIRSGVQASAAALVPVLHNRYRPRSVVDIGCGEGWFCHEFEALGTRAVGVDGAWVDDVIHVDLAAPPYPDLERFDLALCLEVGEHVEQARAPDLVAWLVGLAPIVVFSAAIPGQGGEGHVNEQRPEWWRDLFHATGYAITGALRWQVWDDERIEPWYRQNLLVAGDSGLAEDGCRFVVHPDLWRWKGMMR
jgi:SAM-dependent methyltransferase